MKLERDEEATDPDYVSTEEGAILRRLGHELTREDVYVLSIINPEQRKSMFARLEALAALILDGANVDHAGRMAGVSAPTMYRLKKAWTEQGRGLRSVAGTVGRDPRGPSRRGVREEARRHALDLFENELLADLPAKTLARLVRKSTKDSVSLEVAENVVRDLRLEESRRLAENGDDFGRELVLDACAISMSITERNDTLPLQAILATVLEVSTGLVVACVLCTTRSAVQAQVEAVKVSLETLLLHNMDVQRAEATRLAVTVAPEADPAFKRFVEILDERIGKENVKAHGPRRFGRSTISIIGRKLGRLLLLPASTETARRIPAAVGAAAKRPYTFREARAIVRQSVEQHNEPIFAMLRKRGLATSHSPGDPIRGQMAAALEKALPDADWLKSIPGPEVR